MRCVYARSSEPHRLTGCFVIAADIANWAYGLKLDQVPIEVVRQARRALLDTIGVACAGANHEVTRAARRGFYSPGQGPCSVIGGGRSTAGIAALINATAAHAYDFDDASHTGIMHGSAIIVPAVLALMEEIDATDNEALEAIIIGSEIAYVLGDTLTHRHYLRGWWSTATLSVVAATVAVAKLNRMQADQIAQAIGLAGASAGGARTVVGTDAKPFLCGYVAKSAIEFAAAARAGITGPTDVFESERGFFSLLNDNIWDSDQLATLGKKWRLEDPGLLFKRYPVCSSALAAVEQCVALRARYEIKIDQVCEIQCRIPELVKNSLVYDDPQTFQQAQFSLPFCVACALHLGDVGLEHFSDSVLFAPDIRATMAKVNAVVDPELSSEAMCTRYPESTAVEIHIDDGRVFKGITELASGMPARPLTDDELSVKFYHCVKYATAKQDGELVAVKQMMQSDSGANERNIKEILNVLWANSEAVNFG